MINHLIKCSKDTITIVFSGECVFLDQRNMMIDELLDQKPYQPIQKKSSPEIWSISLLKSEK